MTFLQALKALKEAGITAVPVPGTSKYYIRFQDGKSIFIGEKTFLQLAASMHEHESIETTLRKIPPQSAGGTAAPSPGGKSKICLS